MCLAHSQETRSTIPYACHDPRRPSLSPLDTELQDAIRREDLRGIRSAISYGANPNADDAGDVLLEDVFSCGSAELRMAMLRLMIALGADPSHETDDSSLLYVASFMKNAAEIEFLLVNGANPNPPPDPESLYDLIEFDYREDLLGYPPIKPTAAHRRSEEAWLDYLDRCADTKGVSRPDYLRVLRKYGALSARESRASGRDASNQDDGWRK